MKKFYLAFFVLLICFSTAYGLTVGYSRTFGSPYGPELMTNAGSEDAAASFDDDSDVNTNYSRSSDFARTGTYSAKVLRDIAGTGYHLIGYRDTDLSTVSNGTSYLASCWIYIPSGQTSLSTVTIFISSNGSTYTSGDTISDTDTWVFTEITITAGTEFHFVVRGNDGTLNDAFYIDDISIKEIL